MSVTELKINSFKKEAILQLCNFLCASSITEITELSDGENLLKTIKAKFPEFLNDSPNNCHVEEMPLTKISTESNEVKFACENAEERFNYIRKFIDDCYEIQSSDYISYLECTNKNEVELFKVTIFVLSEIVKHLLEIDEQHLQTLYHLDVKYQVELEDCFKVLISERDQISKGRMKKLLSRTAVKSSPFLTPIRRSPRHKKLEAVSPCTRKEDVFSNSPLKTYFESPIFKKEDILIKDKQIENLKKVLEEADEESSEMFCKLSESEKVLEKKDKEIKRLQACVQELNNEIKGLQNSCQSKICKEEKEKLAKSSKEAQDKASRHLNTIIAQHHEFDLLNEEKNKLEETLDKIRTRRKILTDIDVTSTSVSENKLKEIIKCLEIKIIAYEKLVSQHILPSLKEKPSGNLTMSFEEKFRNLENICRETEENMTSFKDKQILLEEMKKKNKELLEKIKTLEEKSSGKIFTSVTTQTDLSVPEYEIEKVRKSINQSSNDTNSNFSYEFDILNNSNNLIENEQFVVTTKSKISPENISEAVLWKTYDIKPETENTYDINFSHSFSENSHLGMTNNIELENTESDISIDQKDKYIVGKLDFNHFLNELKKLTKNGSFHKVLQVFDNFRKTVVTSASNTVDQELLKILTECVCIVASTNAKPFSNLQDKCCSTDELIHNIDFKKTKKELCDACEKHEIELKNCEKKLNESEEERENLKVKYKVLFHQLAEEKDKILEGVIAKYKNERIAFATLKRKLEERNEAYSDLQIKNKRLLQNYQTLKVFVNNSSKKKNHFDKLIKLLRKKNDFLKQELQEMKEKLIEEAKERESWKCGTWNTNTDSKLFLGEPNSFTVTQFHSQDTANESTLSGAFHKSLSHYECENEDDFVYLTSLQNIKKSFSESTRVQELKRRNSLLPMHLQSAYPVEANLRENYENLYVISDEKYKEQNCNKKRKINPLLEEPSTSFQLNCQITEKPQSSTPKNFKSFVKRAYYNNTLKK